MSKRKSPKKKSTPNKVTTTAVRREIARLDREIASNLQKRAEAFLELAELDAKFLTTPLAEKNVGNPKGPLQGKTIAKILREIESASRAAVSQVKVAFLGPEYSYSHLAAINRFGQSHDLIPNNTIAAVFESVSREDVAFGIVPIENSTDGRIVDTLDMFERTPVKICGEIPVRIHHNLLANCPQSQIREVHSKPQAISQCRSWLEKHLPKAKLVPSGSTTAAAKKAATTKNIAAIASVQAATNYGLNVVASQIEDNKHNVTRFAVIGSSPAKRTGKDKTSIMFELKHEPGALADSMNIFKRNKLNMTWIESFPKKGSQNEYVFFVELEGHQNDLRVRRAIDSLKKKSTRIEILGSYERFQVAD